MPIVELKNIKYSWQQANSPLLDIEYFSIPKGQKMFLKGPSGSGKSTLLGLIAGINQPDSGELSILGSLTSQMSGKQRDHFRANHIGYIFQMFNLLPYLSVIENVCLPCHFSKVRKSKALEQSSRLEDEALRLLLGLQLNKKLLHQPVSQLSMGQQQRVAAARALIGAPELIIADEPTSALDADARESFIQLMFQECELRNTTLLFVSHDDALSPLFDQAIKLCSINSASPGVINAGDNKSTDFIADKETLREEK
jgi:putative ABC transport system ATP-binding protein